MTGVSCPKRRRPATTRLSFRPRVAAPNQTRGGRGRPSRRSAVSVLAGRDRFSVRGCGARAARGRPTTSSSMCWIDAPRPCLAVSFRSVFIVCRMSPTRDRRGLAISLCTLRILGHGVSCKKYRPAGETLLFSKRRTLHALDLARAGGAGRRAPGGGRGLYGRDRPAQAGREACRGAVRTLLLRRTVEAVAFAPEPILLLRRGRGRGTRRRLDPPPRAPSPLALERHEARHPPAGEDPDTPHAARARRHGGGIRQAARPLADALYGLMREAGGDATPEQRAAFLARLDQAAGRIADKALAAEYREALRGRFYAARRLKRGGRTGGPAAAPVRTVVRPRPAPEAVVIERSRILTAVLLRDRACCMRSSTPMPGLSCRSRSIGSAMHCASGRIPPMCLTDRH